jgi:hypothetical protein
MMTRMLGFFRDDGAGDWALVVAATEEIARSRVTAINLSLGFIGVSLLVRYLV